jgi:hypothetical protein
MASSNSSATSGYGASSNFLTDEQSFGRPLFGGNTAVMYATVTFEDTTDTDLFVLPQGAVIVSWMVNIKTAFNDSGTDLLNIGGAATDTYASSLDVGVIGQITAGFVPGPILATALESDTTITAKYTGQNDDADAGEAVVVVTYALM